MLIFKFIHVPTDLAVATAFFTEISIIFGAAMSLTTIKITRISDFLTSTSKTISLCTVLAHSRILFVIRMALWAVRRMFTKWQAPSNVFTVRDWLKMPRVNTITHSAKMVQIKAIWNRPSKHNVGQSMGLDTLCLMFSLITKTQLSIAASYEKTLPYPAARRDQDFAPKSFVNSFCLAHISIVTDMGHEWDEFEEAVEDAS